MQAGIDTIWKPELRRRLARASQVRASFTFLAGACGLVFAGEFWDTNPPWLTAVLILIPPLVVMLITTKLYCENVVRCPKCKESLWKLGTATFKPHRLEVRSDRKHCPHCHTPIV